MSGSDDNDRFRKGTQLEGMSIATEDDDIAFCCCSIEWVWWRRLMLNMIWRDGENTFNSTSQDVFYPLHICWTFHCFVP